jgi:RecA/RadA recombinase
MSTSMANTREHLAQMERVAASFAQWRPAGEVLTPIRAVPTIFPQLDVMLQVNGWPIERFGLVHGPSNEGKAQGIDTPVLTPHGWRRMGDLVVGDEVIAGDGSPTRVTGVFPRGKLQLYRVVFSDGSATECCDEHLWLTCTRNERVRGCFVRGPRPERRRIRIGADGFGTVKNLRSIMVNFKPREHEIPTCGPVQFESIGELPIEPYLLGLLLGDGGFTNSTPRFHNPEEDLCERVRALLPGDDHFGCIDPAACSISIVGGALTKELRKLDLMGLHSWEKFIPELYMRASVEERTSILLGLIDTDGSVVKDGCAVEYSTSSFKLADQVVDLARSLGWVVSAETRRTRYTYKGERLKGRPSMRLRIYAPRGVVPVSSAKHLARWKGRGVHTYRRTIVSIAQSRVSEAVCIMIEHPSHLYVTEDFVVTHNTVLLHGIGRSFLEAGHFYAYVDAEFATPAKWIGTMMAGLAAHPGFRALRPDNYEQTVDAVRDFCHVIGNAKEKGDLDPATSGLVVVDSLRKLVPKDLLTKLMKGAEQDDTEVAGRRGRKQAKRGVDGAGGRAAMIKAAMNAAWFDEVIPMLAQTGTAMIVVARESENVDAGIFGEDFHVQGGKSAFYESSVALRVTRDGWVRMGDDKTPIIGERHTIEQRKTKVEYKVASSFARPRCSFHTSNGTEGPAGFDRERDAIELALELDVCSPSGSWIYYGKTKLGQGLNNAVRKLREDPALAREIETAARAAGVKGGA